MSVGIYTVIVLLVAAERLAELVVSKRNTAWSLARGGREHGFSHYPFMVVLHTGLLVACLVEARHRAYSEVAGISWPGEFHRHDVGWRAIERESAEA